MSAAQASSAGDVPYSGTVSRHMSGGLDVCTYKNAKRAADPVNIYDLHIEVISGTNCYQALAKAEGPGKALPGVGDKAFGYQIGIVFETGGRCVDIDSMTHADLEGDYSHDIAMAKIIIGALH